MLSSTGLSALSLTLELADTQRIAGELNPVVFAGDSFELRAIVSGQERNTGSVEISGLDRFIRSNVSTQSNFSMTNGAITSENTTRYQLQAPQTGTFTIGPARVLHNGQTITSNKLKLTVIPRDEQHLKQVEKDSPSSDVDHELFCQLDVDKKTAVVGEPIQATLSIFTRGNITGINAINPPNFSGCTVKEVQNLRKGEHERDGIQYTVYQKQFVLIPTTAGTYTVQPAQVIYHVPAPQRRHPHFHPLFGDNFLSEFFHGQHAQQKSAASNQISLTITPLPARAGTTDGVGSFSNYTATVDKTKVLVNEPIKLTLEIAGKGNFDQITIPALILPETFKSYESKVETNEQLVNAYEGGSKKFEFVVQVNQGGTQTLPEQTFHYFDTDDHAYKIIKTRPISLAITMPKNSQTTRLQQILVSDETEEKPDQEVSQVHDIHFIEEDIPLNSTKQNTFPYWLFVILFLCAPFILYHTPITRTIRYTRTRFFSPYKNILARFTDKLTHLFAQKNIHALYKLFIHFFALIHTVSSHIVTEDWIEERLYTAGWEEEKITGFLQFLNICAQHSFTTQELSPKQLHDLEKQANYWLIVINETSRNHKKQSREDR